MFEPRVNTNQLSRPELRFLGGTENFDLWVRVSTRSSEEAEIYPLRVHRVAGGETNWDVFKLPLRLNNEVDTHMPPLERRYAGYWSDVLLSRDDADIIEAFLRCFGPGLLEQALTEEEDR